MTPGSASMPSIPAGSARCCQDGSPLTIEDWPDSDSLDFPNGLSGDGLTARGRR